MFCPTCGTQNPDNSQFCLACGTRFAAPPTPQYQQAPPPQYPQPPQGQQPPPPPYQQPPYPQPQPQYQQPYPPPPQYGYPPPPYPGAPGMGMGVMYAGFWLRVAAYLIDSVIVSLPIVLLMIPFSGFVIAMARNAGPNGEIQPEQIVPFVASIFALVAVAFLGSWLYFAYMESSARQATFGKKILGLAVTDLQLQRISFWRATGRTFAKILSGILYIGFIMVGVTERKQGLHDMIAGTLVIRKQ